MMEISELAAQIASSMEEMNHAKFGYYMTNINHPVIDALKRRYCADRKIHNHTPMSDQERIEFELWLFQPSIRKMVEKIFCGEEENGAKK
jgi:hypothetical protein